MQPMDSSFLIVTLFSPLFGSCSSGLLGKMLGDRFAKSVSILGMILSLAASWYIMGHIVYSGPQDKLVPIATWISSSTFNISWDLRLDTLSVSMATIVTSISFLVHIYSIGYMSREEMPTYRFFSYLSLFTFSMLLLVTSCNLVGLYCGWEAVGLSSYLLIGYWYTKPAAVAAAIKAFVVNRIADLFFLIGISLLFILSDSVYFSDIFQRAPELLRTHYDFIGYDFKACEMISFLLFVGAMGKSAQLFFHVWLPDAMEGPTPVSALIHAATMVTAGVFLMARMSPILEIAYYTRALILIIGSITAFFAASVALTQTDIKKSIAYSTCSQLGYMFVAIGCGAYQIALFHLTTHAFFKALLFLGAGSVIHALHNEQDMFKMGGLAKKLPFTCVVMWIGSLALAGIFPFAGYWSKDAIMKSAWMYNSNCSYFAWVITSLTAFLTALYSWRLLFLVFHAPSKNQALTSKAKESPSVMINPMGVLALGSVCSGFILSSYYIGSKHTHFWGSSIFTGTNNHILSLIHRTPLFIAQTPSILAILGILVAYICYVRFPILPTKLANSFSGPYRFLINAWYFDRLYQIIFIKPYHILSKILWNIGEKEIIEGAPLIIADFTQRSAKTISRTQNGSFALYALTLVIGLVIILTTFLIYH